jgi:probable phosphoglycerate mutase
MELYVLARHGESTLNFENRINGDFSVPVALTEKGREEAEFLGQQLAHVRIDVCVHTRFSRTRETAEIALGGRNVPFEVEPLLDDIYVGGLEGATIEDYRAWKREHERVAG